MVVFRDVTRAHRGRCPVKWLRRQDEVYQGPMDRHTCYLLYKAAASICGCLCLSVPPPILFDTTVGPKTMNKCGIHMQIDLGMVGPKKHPPPTHPRGGRDPREGGREGPRGGREGPRAKEGNQLVRQLRRIVVQCMETDTKMDKRLVKKGDSELCSYTVQSPVCWNTESA